MDERVGHPAGRYYEAAPAAALSRHVSSVWRREVPAGPQRSYRIVPDGCADIIWDGASLYVAGPDTGPMLTALTPAARLTALRFRPGSAPAVLGVPAWELRDSRVDLEALWGEDARRLAQRLADRPDHDSAARELQGTVAGRLTADVEPVVPAVVQAVAVRPYQNGPPSVAGLARAVGYSERQLRRRCLDAFGYGPATLRRILRFQRAVILARSGRFRSHAELAAALGYTDQAHLAREVRDLAGVPLSRLLPTIVGTRMETSPAR